MVSFAKVQESRESVVERATKRMVARNLANAAADAPVNNGVILDTMVQMAAVAAREAAERDIAADAPAIDPSEVAQHMADVKTHNASHAAATTPTEPVTVKMWDTLRNELTFLRNRIDGLEHNAAVNANALALSDKREAALRESVAGSALKTEGIPEAAAKTGSTGILDEMAAAAKIVRGTVRNQLDGTDGPGNRWLPLRRMACERAAAANNGRGRTFTGRSPITTDEQLLTWLNTHNVQIATTPWLFLRSLSDTPSIWVQAYRNLFTASPAAGGKGWTDAQFDTYVVPFGQHPTDPTE